MRCMEELRPSSGPHESEWVSLRFEGREPAAIGFLPLARNGYMGDLDSLNCSTSRLRDLSETCALRKARLVFMANYPLERREDL